MGAEDTWKSWKTATDDDVTRLPKSQAEGTLSDDMDVKNDLKVETKMKLEHGSLKYGFTQTTSQDKSGNVTHNVADDAQMDTKIHGQDLRVKLKPKEIIKTLDLGTMKLLDGKQLTNPYVEWQTSRSLENNTFSLGHVSRYNSLKVNKKQLVNNSGLNLDSNLQWKNDRQSFSLRQLTKLCNFTSLNSNFKTEFVKDKTTVALEGSRGQGEVLSNFDWLALHLHHNVCKGFTVAAKATQFTDDSTSRQLEVGYAWDLGNGGKLKMKTDLDQNCWTSFAFKANDKASLLLTMQNNRGNLGQMNPSWKGFLGLPFNFGMKLKLDC